MADALIVDVVRTPSGRGKPGGALSGIHPAQLLATVLRALVQRTGIDPGAVDDVICGCVLPVRDQAFNIARTGLLVAGFPESVPGVTIDRQCGSSQQAVHFAAQGVQAGAYDVAIACGVEQMSGIPMPTPAMDAAPFGPLSARYPSLPHQGIAAELIAARWGFGREELDAYAARSHRLAAACAADGGFAREIVPVEVPGESCPVVVTSDETVRAATTPQSLAALAPAFRSESVAARYPQLRWGITPGNSSPYTDGASAALIVSEAAAAYWGLTARARVSHLTVLGSDPEYMLTGPIPATRRLLERSGLSLADVDAYEVNEAFASVPLAWAKELGADPDRLNPRGGAIALGHPLGASGVRLLATLVNHLEQTGGRRGLQTMCEGDGMANAMVVERL